MGLKGRFKINGHNGHNAKPTMAKPFLVNLFILTFRSAKAGSQYCKKVAFFPASDTLLVSS